MSTARKDMMAQLAEARRTHQEKQADHDDFRGYQMSIPGEAVEAAARARAVPGFEWEFYLDDARKILEAAAPHMLNLAKREAWDANLEIQRLRAEVQERDAALALIANQCGAAEILCRANDMDLGLAVVPVGAVRAALKDTK